MNTLAYTHVQKTGCKQIHPSFSFSFLVFQGPKFSKFSRTPPKKKKPKAEKAKAEKKKNDVFVCAQF
jgi:hypothetical protein